MLLILRQLAILAGFVGVIYGAWIAVALMIEPLPRQTEPLDSPSARDTVFMTQPKYVFLNRASLSVDRGKDEVILIGSSNIARGFALRELQPLVPSAAIHNLAVSGSNNGEVRQVLDLIQDMRDEALRRRTIFVIGIWYGMFVEDRVRWSSSDRAAGDTDIDIERYRYGFYRRTPDGPVAVLPPRHLEAGLLAIYPFLALDRVVRGVRDTAHDQVLSWLNRPKLGDDQEDAHVVDQREQAKWLAYRVDYMKTSGGALADEQFDVLRGMVDAVLASGGRVALVDLPIPRWHSQASPHFAFYQERKKPLLSALTARAGVRYLNLQDLDTDADYYDDTHAKRRVTHVWSERLADVLNSMLNQGGAQPPSRHQAGNPISAAR